MGMGSQLQQGGIGNLGAIRPRVRPDPRPHGNVGMGPNDYIVPNFGPRPSFGPGPRPFPNRPPSLKRPPFYTNIPDFNGYDRFGPPFLTGIPRGEDGSIYGPRRRKGRGRGDTISLTPVYEPPVVVEDPGPVPDSAVDPNLPDPNLIGQPAPPVGNMPPLFLAEGGGTNPADEWWSGPYPMSGDAPFAADFKEGLTNMPTVEARAIRSDFSNFPRSGGGKGGKGGVSGPSTVTRYPYPGKGGDFGSRRMFPSYGTGAPPIMFDAAQGRPGIGPGQRMMGESTGQVAEPQEVTADIIRRRMYGGI